MKFFGSELLAEGESVCELMLEDLNVFILGDDGVPHIVLRFALFGHGDILGRVEGDLQRQPPLQIMIDEETFEEISTQALRVKLISNSLKNPKKSWTRLETKYHETMEKRKSKQFRTETSEDFKQEDELRARFMNLE